MLSNSQIRRRKASAARDSPVRLSSEAPEGEDGFVTKRRLNLAVVIIFLFVTGLKYYPETKDYAGRLLVSRQTKNPAASLRGAPEGATRRVETGTTTTGTLDYRSLYNGRLQGSQQTERHLARLHSWDEVRNAFEVPLERREPFVVASHLTKDWPIFEEWGSMEALNQRVGDIEALVSVGRAIEGSEDDTIEGHTIRSALGASLSGLLGGPAFVGFRPTLNLWSKMRQSLNIPKYFDDTRFLSCLGPRHMADFYEAFNWKMFFMSQAGAGMHMHTDADRAHLYTLQLGGSKSWFLCRGNETRGVYSGRVDAFALENGEKFPLFAETQPRCYRTDLAAGEILYWHSDWWHQTYVDKNATSPSFSILSLFIDEDIIRLTSPKTGKPVFDLMKSHQYKRKKSANLEFPKKLNTCMKNWRNKVHRWDAIVNFMSLFGFSL